MVGGIAEYLHGLAAALSSEGETVSVHCFGVDAEPSFDPPYEVQYEGPIPERRAGDRWGDEIAAARKLNSALCAARRVVHGWQTARSVLNRYDRDELRVYIGVWNEEASGWCRRFRRDSVSYRLFAHGREIVRSLDPIRRGWRRDDFETAARVYTCSEATSSLVQKRFGDVPTRTVRPGVSEPADEDAVERIAERLRDKLGIEEHERILVTVGRLVERKGVGSILEALATPALEERPVRYVVAGEGPRGAEFRKRAQQLGLGETVEFLGHVSEPTKWAVYRMGDLFVMPNSALSGTDWEGFGIVFLEAAVMGLPSIGGRSGGAKEAVVHGRTGYLVDPASRSDLVDRLVRLIDDPGLCKRLGSSARRRALHEFTWTRAARRLIEDG